MRAKLLTIRHKKKGTIERVPEHEARASSFGLDGMFPQLFISRPDIDDEGPKMIASTRPRMSGSFEGGNRNSLKIRFPELCNASVITPWIAEPILIYIIEEGDVSSILSVVRNFTARLGQYAASPA
jgi:hypothetical protein